MSDDRNTLLVKELTASQTRLYGFILTLLPDRERAKDVLQETNMVIWRKSAEFEPGTNFWAWSCSIARFCVLSYYRDSGRDLHTFDDSIFASLADVAQQQSADDVRADALVECLKALPSEQLHMIEQRYSHGEPVQAIADGQNRTVAAIKMSLLRIRRALLACIDRKTGGDRPTMSHAPELPEDLARLLSEQLDAELSGEQHADLQAILADDHAAQVEYARLMTLHAMLDVELGEQGLSAHIDAAQAPIVERRSVWQVVYDIASDYVALSLLISAITMAIIVLSLGLFKTQQPEPFVPAETIRFLARITDSQDVIWMYRDNQPVERAHLSPGRELALRSGLIEVTFDDGAVVLLEGPAEFQIDSAGAGTLTRGTLVARVPKRAIGFTVHTPYGDVVDLGTEFSVSIDASEHAATVQVFQGAVEYRSSGVPDQRLVAGSGLRKVDDRFELFTADGRTFAAMRENFASSNLLVNGGFDDFESAKPNSTITTLIQENGEQFGWQLANEKPFGIRPQSSRLRPCSHPNYAQFLGQPDGGSGIVQTFATTAGTVYVIDLRVARYGDKSTPSLSVDAFDGQEPVADDSPTGDLVHESIFIDWPEDSWRTKRIEFTARSKWTTLRLLEPVDSASFSVAPCIDDVSVFEVATE